MVILVDDAGVSMMSRTFSIWETDRQCSWFKIF